ncbi:MAG: RES family NAD+ phosphorylase, partial [Bacteroidota bacterium]
NPIGVPALYTSENRALATLELLVHLPKQFLPPTYVFLTINIPDESSKQIVSIPIDTLLKVWSSLQADDWTMNFGRSQFQDKNALGIRVPSTIITEEYNIVLNPLHLDYRKIEIDRQSIFSLDNRLFE